MTHDGIAAGDEISGRLLAQSMVLRALARNIYSVPDIRMAAREIVLLRILTAGAAETDACRNAAMDELDRIFD